MVSISQRRSKMAQAVEEVVEEVVETAKYYAVKVKALTETAYHKVKKAAWWLFDTAVLIAKAAVVFWAAKTFIVRPLGWLLAKIFFKKKVPVATQPASTPAWSEAELAELRAEGIVPPANPQPYGEFSGHMDDVMEMTSAYKEAEGIVGKKLGVEFYGSTDPAEIVEKFNLHNEVSSHLKATGDLN